MEAGIEARYHLAHVWPKKVVDGDSDFRSVSSKGAVPVLVLDNSDRLTESAAVLQYIADLKPRARPCTAARPSRSLSPAGVALHGRGCASHLDLAAAPCRRRRCGTMAAARGLSSRMQARPQVKAAIGVEAALRKTLGA